MTTKREEFNAALKVALKAQDKVAMSTIRLSFEGIILAVISGAVASGIGYTVWYIALSGLSATEAAVVQLSVPVIAAIGGILFLSEAITVRLIFTAVMILGGILTVVLGRYYFVQLRVEVKDRAEVGDDGAPLRRSEL